MGSIFYKYIFETTCAPWNWLYFQNGDIAHVNIHCGVVRWRECTEQGKTSPYDDGTHEKFAILAPGRDVISDNSLSGSLAPGTVCPPDWQARPHPAITYLSHHLFV